MNKTRRWWVQSADTICSNPCNPLQYLHASVWIAWSWHLTIWLLNLNVSLLRETVIPNHLVWSSCGCPLATVLHVRLCQFFSCIWYFTLQRIAQSVKPVYDLLISYGAFCAWAMRTGDLDLWPLGISSNACYRRLVFQILNLLLGYLILVQATRVTGSNWSCNLGF